MPTYKVKDPETGKVASLVGDSPPTEQELEEIFKKVKDEPSFFQKANKALGAGAQIGLDVATAAYEGVGEAMRLPMEGKPLSDFRLPSIIQKWRNRSMQVDEVPADPISQVNKGVRAAAGFVEGLTGFSDAGPAGLEAAKAQAKAEYGADRGGMGVVEDLAGGLLLGKVSPQAANAPITAVEKGVINPIRQFVKAPFAGRMLKDNAKRLRIKELAAAKGIDLSAADLVDSKGLAFFEKVFENGLLTTDIMHDAGVQKLNQLIKMRNKILDASDAGTAHRDVEVLGQRIQALADDFVRGKARGSQAELVRLKDAMLKKMGSHSTYEELGAAGKESIAKNAADYAARATEQFKAVGAMIPAGATHKPTALVETAKKLLAQEVKLPPTQRNQKLYSHLVDIVGKEDPDVVKLMAGLSPEAKAALQAQLPDPLPPVDWEGLQMIESDYGSRIRELNPEGRAMTGDRISGAYKQLRSSARKELETFAKSTGTDAFDALMLAKKTYAEKKQVFDAPYLNRVAKLNPSVFIDTIFTPSNARMIDDVKAAVGQKTFESLRGGMTNKLLGVGKSTEAFDPVALRKTLDGYGDEVLTKIYGEKTKDLYALSEMGEKITKESVTNDFFKNLVDADATKVLNYVVKAGDTDNFNLVKDAMGEKGVNHVRQALLGKLFAENQHGLFSPQKFHTAVTKYGDKTLQAWLPKDVYKDVKDAADISFYSGAAERAASNPSQTARNLMVVNDGKMILRDPIRGLETTIPSWVLGKLYMNPRTREWLTGAMKIQASDPKSLNLYRLISAELAKPEKILDSPKPVFADEITRPMTPMDDPKEISKEHYRAGLEAFLEKDMRTTRKNWELAAKIDSQNLEAARGLERLDMREGRIKAKPTSEKSKESYRSGLEAFLKGNQGVALSKWKTAYAQDRNNLEAKRGIERIEQKQKAQTALAGAVDE